MERFFFREEEEDRPIWSYLQILHKETTKPRKIKVEKEKKTSENGTRKDERK